MAYDRAMKRAVLALCLMVSPAFADGETEQGFDLMQQGSRLLLRGLIDRIEPDLRALAEEMGPALLELQGVIGDLTQYLAPEVLPNGDIIIRRKVPLVPGVPGGEIEL